MKPLDPERTLLLKAADLIKERGWHQRDFTTRDPVTQEYVKTGPLCIYGALNLTVSDTPNWACIGGEIPAPYLKAVDLAHEVLATQLGHSIPCLDLWNDIPGRTKEEVLSLLRTAAMHGL